MFDTIHLYLRQDSVTDTDLLSEIPVHLQNKALHEDEKGISYTGTLKNLKIYVSDRVLSIKGSLAKFYLDDNFNTLDRNDTAQAIESISDHLKIPIHEAKVSRVDFAENFEMKYTPGIYYHHLGQSQFFNRYEQNKSLYYTNGRRQKVFYDKIAEAKNKKTDIPHKYRKKNILRYEIRYKRRLSKQFKVSYEIKASTLYHEQFFHMMIERFISDYDSIHKLQSFQFNTEKLHSPKDVTNQLAVIGLNAIGPHRYAEMVEEWREKDVFDKPSYYSKVKSNMRKLATKYVDSDSEPIIEELNEKVSAVKDRL